MPVTPGLSLKLTLRPFAVGIICSVCLPTLAQEVQRVPVFRSEHPTTISSEAIPATPVGPSTVDGAVLPGYPQDWTHHRVLFTDPGSEEEAIRKGRYAEWVHVVNDPRYLLYAVRRRMAAQGPFAQETAEREATRAKVEAIVEAATSGGEVQSESLNGQVAPVHFFPHPIKVTSASSPNANDAKEDWNVPLATGNSIQGTSLLTVNILDDSGGRLAGATMQPTVYPAKFTYNSNGSGNCSNDYIVYPTGLAGVTTGKFTVPAISLLGLNLGTVTVNGPGTPNIIAYNNLDTGLLSGLTSCGTLLAGVLNLSALVNSNLSPNPTVMWAYNTGGPVTSSPILSLDGSQVAYIQQTSATSKAAQLALLKWSSPGNSGTVGLSVGGLLTIGASVTMNGYEYSYGLLNIGLINIGGLTSNYPAATAPSSVSCSTAGGAYQTATAGVGSGAAETPYLCLTTLKAGGSTAPTVTHSHPFPDYTNGALYVGDDQGYLHMFTGLSFGMPGTATGQAGSTAAITETAPMPLSNYPLGAPAYDSVSGCIFVGDSAGVLYEVNPGFSNGTVCKAATPGLTQYARSAPLANSSTNGILDAPMVDSNSQSVYAFVSSSSTAGGLTSGSNAIYEFVTGFTGTNAAPVAAQAVGTGGNTLEFLDGDFDNVYYSSTTGTGNMYVVGNTHALGNGSLFRVPVTNNRLGTAVNLGAVNASSGQYAYASPVMEFCNNGGAPCTVSGGQTTAGLDIVYFSVYKGTGSLLGGVSQLLTITNCSLSSLLLAPGGCIFGVNVSNPAAPSLYADYYTSWAGASNPCWATSGFIVDNADSSLLNLNLLGTGSQMYFVGMNGNSDGLLSNYDPCGASKITSNTISAQQIGQGNLIL